MQAGYENLLGTIDLYVATEDSLAGEEATKLRATIMNDLVTLQRLEANIPGVEPLTALPQS